MAGIIFTSPYFTALDNVGVSLDGAKWYFYLTGTLTPLDTYTSSALSTPHTNPVVAGLDGKFPPIYFDGTKTYRGVLKDKNDNPVGSYGDIDPINTGLDAATLLYTPNGSGAQTRDQENFNDEYVSVFNFIPQAQHAAILARTSTFDATADIQEAITYAASVRKKLWVPAGLYKIVPATVVTAEGGSETTAFTMASHLHIEAEEGATFRLADNQSTDGTPKALNMFFTNGTLTNVTFRGLTMDMNGANNPISPSRPTYDVSKNMAMICVSGTPAGVAARIDDVLIENCTFQNTSGVCCIVVAQSNTLAVTLGKRWTIRNNLFLNNGTDTSDHTSVFAWANDVLCEGNTFWSDTQYATVGKTGGVTGYEIHGSNHRFIGNRVKNYLRGMWVSSNYTSAVENSVIEGNNFETMFYGIDFFRSVSTLTTTRNTLISGNTFLFDGSDYSGAPTQKAGVNIACDYAVSDILIEGNMLRSTDTITTSGTSLVVIAPQSVASNTYKNITIRGNQQFGGTDGVFVRTSATNGLGYLCVENNSFVDLSNTATSTAPIGIFVDGVTAVSVLAMDGNSFVDSRGGSAEFDYGIYLQGTVTNLLLGKNQAVGMVTADYLENTFTATNRKGVYSGAATYNPASLADGEGATTTVTVTGAALGDRAYASFSLDLQGIILTPYVSAANTVSVRFQNETTGVLDLGSGTLRAWVEKL